MCLGGVLCGFFLVRCREGNKITHSTREKVRNIDREREIGNTFAMGCLCACVREGSFVVGSVTGYEGNACLPSQCTRKSWDGYSSSQPGGWSRSHFRKPLCCLSWTQSVRIYFRVLSFCWWLTLSHYYCFPPVWVHLLRFRWSKWF